MSSVEPELYLELKYSDSSVSAQFWKCGYSIGLEVFYVLYHVYADIQTHNAKAHRKEGH